MPVTRRRMGLAALLLASLMMAGGVASRALLWHPQAQPTLTGDKSQPTLAGDKAHPARAAGWVDTELYFGLGPAEDAAKGVSEAGWRAFLDREVTPRFPDGLSVIDVYGQWQGKGESVPERIRTKLLIVDYPETAENERKVAAIRAAWKQKTGDQSVMKVTRPADVSF